MNDMKLQGANEQQSAMVAAFFERHQSTLSELSFEIHIVRLDVMTRETFRAVAHRNGSAITATLHVTDSHSLRWALNALRKWATKTAETDLDLTDKPEFRYRGTIEGFYGTPWSPAQRLKGVEAFGDYGMNIFLVAPKDAHWQRFQWREPLHDSFVAELSELIARGSLHGVDVSACVSPGLSVVYSDDSDVAAVVSKFMQLANIGARHFGLLLDDIPDTLNAAADIARYSNIAAAHADFSNRVYAALLEQMPSAHLILCPMHYAGRGTEPYLHVMGDQLHPQIDLMWTGREICSGYLDIADAVVFDRSTRRPPFYWDNYPVNDGSMSNRLHIGPVDGRESGLHRFAVGLLANPMELFEASLIPLGTIGDYLWSTTSYDPWSSWESVLVDAIPDAEDRSATREFFRNTLGLTGAWSPAFNSIIGECSTAWRNGRPDDAAATAHRGAATIANAHARITASDYCAPLLRVEIAPWLEKYALGGTWLERMAKVLDACSVNPSGQLTATSRERDELYALRAELGTYSRRLFGDGFDIMLGELAAEILYTEI